MTAVGVRRVALLALLLGLVASGRAAAVALPQVHGDGDAPECRDAALLAQAMFKSASPRVYAPLQLPAGMASELLLGALALDISGGNALLDAGGFEKIPQPDLRSVYWEQAAKADARIVLREANGGWRGDRYALYLPDRAMAQADFLRALASGSGDGLALQLDNAWRPPLVFRLRATGGKWFIDVGQPFAPLDGWRVFAATDGHYAQRCTIVFQPEAVATQARLPGALGDLLRLLDQALGPGNDEGSLQQTARLRNGVLHIVANARLRPWAVSAADAYNTRAEVDAGLARWAVNRQRRALQARIAQVYPEAQRALAAHYQRSQDMPEAKADAEAGRVLDLLLRAHFVFPKH